MNIIYILQLIATKLNIDENILIDTIKNKVNDKELTNIITDSDKLDKINNLLKIDSQFNDFEKNNIKNENTKQNFNKLKQNLGKLQILVLINKLSKSDKCDDIINALLNILTEKFENINNILSTDLIQIGGNQNKYYKKYIKYKKKYLKLYLYNLYNE